jgi:hypothetical protein
MLSRRNILAAACTAPAAVAVSKAAPADAASPPPPLEFPTPEAHVRAFIKLLASLEAETVFHTYEGTLEALIPGRAPVKLVDSTTVIRRQVEVKPQGHHISIWEATVYHRPGESEPLDAFVNPLNGRTVRPFHQREGRGESRWTEHGSQFLRSDGTWVSSNRTGKPFALEWSQAGERIWTSRYNSGVYLKHPLDPVNWPLEYAGPDLLYSDKTTSNGLVRELADPSVTNASATYSLNQAMIWWPWLLMGQQPGFLVWNTNGVKLSDPDAISVEHRKMVEQIHPMIFGPEAPWEGHVNLWTDYPKMRSPEKV